MAEYTEHIKVNIPRDNDSYINGFGEGVWVLVTPEVKAAHDSDETGTTYDGILDNDTYYSPALIHGVLIPFEMRGDKRPVVPFNWLLEHYGPCQDDIYINGTSE